MPAYARKHQLNTSLIYHVYSRSSGKAHIFKSKDDFCCFAGLLSRYSLEFALKIYHWVIMSNHYHLLLELADPRQISRVMAGLSKAYSCYYHKTYSAVGFLWQGRFKLQPIQKEGYLFACGRYIERNPLRAGLVNEAHEYPYSSAGFYCSGKPDGITAENPLFLEFGREIILRRKAYTKFLRNFNPEEEEYFNNLEQPVGNSVFVAKLLKENGRYVPRLRGRPRKRIVA